MWKFNLSLQMNSRVNTITNYVGSLTNTRMATPDSRQLANVVSKFSLREGTFFFAVS